MGAECQEILRTSEGWACLSAPAHGRVLVALGEADLAPELGADLVAAVAPHLPDGPLSPEGGHLTCGYWLVRVGAPAGGALWQRALSAQAGAPARRAGLELLALHEAREMDARGGYAFEPGVSRALRTAESQRRALARWDLPRREAAPWAGSGALACSRVDAADAFFAHRQAPGSGNDSGWRFGCLDPDHAHRGPELRIVTTGHLVGRFPELTQYLGFPQGWVISRDAEGYWVTPPGEARSFRDEGHEPGVPWVRSRQEQNDGR